MSVNLKKYIREGRYVADITPLFLDNEAFVDATSELLEMFKDVNFDKIACVEGRGFIIGSAAAVIDRKGLVLLRGKDKLQREIYSVEFEDYLKRRKTLEIHKDAVLPGEKVIIIDDWIESGGTVKAGISLIEKCGGEVVGIGALVDGSNDTLKNFLQKYSYKYLTQNNRTKK